MDKSLNKRKCNLWLGLLGCVLFMIGDWLLDIKGSGNITKGLVESNWVNMSMWRFEVSILLGALGTPLYWFAAKEIIAILKQLPSKDIWTRRMERIYLFGTFSAVLSWVFIHIMCCLLPIIFKCTYAVFPNFEEVTTVVNSLFGYFIVPFAAYFILSDGCLSIAWIFFAWKRTFNYSRIAVLCCPLFTVLLAFIVDNIPLLCQFTGAFESMGHFAMIAVVLHSKHYMNGKMNSQEKCITENMVKHSL